MAPQDNPAMILLLIRGGLLEQVTRNDALRSIVVVASAGPMVGNEGAISPERSQDALDSRWTEPGVTISRRRAVLEFEGRERPTRVDFLEGRTNHFGMRFEHRAIVPGWIEASCHRPLRPVGDRDETGLFIPGVVRNPLTVGMGLPVVDPIPGHPR